MLLRRTHQLSFVSTGKNKISLLVFYLLQGSKVTLMMQRDSFNLFTPSGYSPTVECLLEERCLETQTPCSLSPCLVVASLLWRVMVST